MDAYVGMKLSFKIPGHKCEGKIREIEYIDHYNPTKTKWLIIDGVRDDGLKCGLSIMACNLKDYMIEHQLNKIEQLSLFD